VKKGASVGWPRQATRPQTQQELVIETRIHTATTADSDTIAGMVVELLKEIMAQTGDRHFDADRPAIAFRCAQFIAGGIYTVLLARLAAGGSPLGCITLTEVHALYAGGAFGVIAELYVRPGFRSEGIGKALIMAAKDHGRERGWTRLEVTTPPLPQFERALQFYEAHGFEVTGGRKLKVQL
jgi:GNAT superfamily N-acetyltransferase